MPHNTLKNTKKDSSSNGHDSVDSTDSGNADVDKRAPQSKKLPKEIGGPAGPEPTRYGDWERNGRCSDF